MNYNDIEKAIQNNEPFTHNGTMTGEITTAGLMIKKTKSGEKSYCVYSYSTLMYEENLETRETWYNDKKYSQTTSRQQSIIKRAKGIK